MNEDVFVCSRLLSSQGRSPECWMTVFDDEEEERRAGSEPAYKPLEQVSEPRG